MAVQLALKRSFVQRLQQGIGANLGKYSANDGWVAGFAGSLEWQFATACETTGQLELMPPDDQGHRDLENAIRIHKALSNLSLLQASDPRLWTRLTHVELWRYMRKRWPVERYMSDRAKAQRFVLSRYFVAQNQSRALLRNGAARLWWTARLTYDPDRPNPYELTWVLLKSLDIAQQLLERNLGRIPRLTRAFLDYLLRNKSECIDGGDSSRRLVRRLAKALNLHGGVCLLDCMTTDQIVAFLDNEKARFLAGGAMIEGDDDQQNDEDFDL